MINALSRLASLVLLLPRSAKRLTAVSVDVSLCVLSVWMAFYLRTGVFAALTGGAVLAVLVSVCLAIPIFIGFGLYRAIFRYSGMPAIVTIGTAVGSYGLLYALVFLVVGVADVPRTIGLIQPMLLLLLVGMTRVLTRVWLGGLYRHQLKKAKLPKVLIYGAGTAGRQLTIAMSNSHEMMPIGFLDDDERLHGHLLNGLPIHSPADLPGLVESHDVNHVLLALPSISRKRRNEILSQIREAKVSVHTLPGAKDLSQGKITAADIRELDIDDLLGREPVVPNHILLGKNIASKVVLVTGAGGSIGSELCRQILQIHPTTLLLVEQSEFALYQLQQELQDKADANPTSLVPLLASVRDEDRMREVMQTWRPDSIYHAAAYKHVPLVEHNPSEGVKNNVFGTLTVAKVAAECGVSDFVLISTDKAVRPTNIMGASKRLAEMTLQGLSSIAPAFADSGRPVTRFSMVRFGNVLGSSGSVVPKFRQQIRVGGPITLTHADISRYFMTIPEAAQLVIQAGAMAKGGEVFVLDMGPSVKIIDLARRMVELSGLTVKDAAHVHGDIEIIVTGLRPGEKLYEELLIGDNPMPTIHPRIMKAHEEFLPWSDLESKLKSLDAALNANKVGVVRQMLSTMVKGYSPSGDIVDWIYLEQLSDAEAPKKAQAFGIE